MGLERLLMVVQGQASVFDCDVIQPWTTAVTSLWQPGHRVRGVLRGEERRFASLLTRGRKVLAQLRPGRPLTEGDLRYLHQTHGLPPELVTELLESGSGNANTQDRATWA
jgi:alanyl-tRNA synthetase